MINYKCYRRQYRYCFNSTLCNKNSHYFVLGTFDITVHLITYIVYSYTKIIIVD